MRNGEEAKEQQPGPAQAPTAEVAKSPDESGILVENVFADRNSLDIVGFHVKVRNTATKDCESLLLEAIITNSAGTVIETSFGSIGHVPAGGFAVVDIPSFKAGGSTKYSIRVKYASFE